MLSGIVWFCAIRCSVNLTGRFVTGRFATKSFRYQSFRYKVVSPHHVHMALKLTLLTSYN